MKMVKRWLSLVLALALALSCLLAGSLVSADNTCAVCDGTGRCTVSSCSNGRCVYCNGTGRDLCSKCNGSGHCTRCNGQGGWNEGFVWKDCFSCSGTGNCSLCHGMGGNRCIICGGTGDCRICNGTGICPGCNGTGKIGTSQPAETTPPATEPTQPVVETISITFSGNGGSGAMAGQTATSGSPYTLPECTFTPPAGKCFKAWSVNGTEYAPGSAVTLWAGTTVSALWKDMPASGFSDVPDDAWFATPVIWSVENQITSGTSATTFSPNQVCTLAQILTLLARAYDASPSTIPNPFTDVSEDAFYYQSVLWAYEQGMVSGGALAPDAPCTRAMAVTYLWKAAGSPVLQSGTGFSDVPASSPYAQAVSWAVAQGITSGTTDTTFSPDKTCTRAEIVMFLYRSLTGASGV